MSIKGLLFAGLRDVVGQDSVEIETAVTTVAELCVALETEFPQLAGQVYKLAIDQAYASSKSTLEGATEIALIPPVSGG